MNEGMLWGGFIGLLILALIVAIYPLRHAKKTGSILTLMILLYVVMAYAYWGALPQWRHHLQQQASLQQIQTVLQSVKGPAALIEKLKARLTEEPEKARGWYLLGRLYASQEQWQLAETAFLKAHRLEPANEQITVNYAQSLWQLNHQRFNGTIRGLFQAVLKKNKNQPDALGMLAIDAFQSHDYQEAINDWQRLLDLVAPQSEDAKSIRKAIAKAQAQLRLGNLTK